MVREEFALDELDLVRMFEECSNAGRWGVDDELGTLNYITDEKRRSAAQLVREGRVIAIGQPLSRLASATNVRPATHIMLLEQNPPLSAIDYVGVAAHGFAVTHLDAVAHVFWEGKAYNKRRSEDVLSQAGLSFGSIHAQRQGIFTRGVLLDVAAARGAPWLEPDEFVTEADLEQAELAQGTSVASGDALIVHTGLEARVAAHGPEDPSRRAGLDGGAVRWLHQREVAVYSGDCVERIPYPSKRVPLPLHQIGLVSMGLCLLDCPTLTELVALTRVLGRADFLLTCAPIDVPGGTGVPVNPLCVF